VNAGKLASIAKDNVVKLSSNAAQQAVELTKNVNEKVKEGSLLDSLSYGVTNVSSKVGNAWSNLTSSYWTGGDQLPSIKNSNSSSGLFGRSGYNTVPGESNSFNNSFNTSNNSYNNNNLFSDDSNDGNMKRTPPKNSTSQNNKSNNEWDWDESWDNNNDKSSSKTNKSSSASKPSKPSPPKAKDLMNFDDDNWETIEPSKSK
jgi:hypothetical protein